VFQGYGLFVIIIIEQSIKQDILEAHAASLPIENIVPLTSRCQHVDSEHLLCVIDVIKRNRSNDADFSFSYN